MYPFEAALLLCQYKLTLKKGNNKKRRRTLASHNLIVYRSHLITKNITVTWPLLSLCGIRTIIIWLLPQGADGGAVPTLDEKRGLPIWDRGRGYLPTLDGVWGTYLGWGEGTYPRQVMPLVVRVLWLPAGGLSCSFLRTKKWNTLCVCRKFVLYVHDAHELKYEIRNLTAYDVALLLTQNCMFTYFTVGTATATPRCQPTAGKLQGSVCTGRCREQ